MGKIVRFDTSRRRAIPNAAVKREIMAAAARAANRGSPLAYRRTGRAEWKLSGLGIFNLAMVTFLAVWFLPDYVIPIGSSPVSATTDTETANFSFCHSGGGTNCVVDGDTIWYQGNNIRIADIDTPETHPPSCAREAELGATATQRLQSLLNAGSFSVESTDRDADRYGRQLRVLTRGGESIGGMLVEEGLARWYGGGRQSWC